MGFWKSTLSNVIATLIGALLIALMPKFLAILGLFPSGLAVFVEWSQWVWLKLTAPVPVPAYGVAIMALVFFVLGRRYTSSIVRFEDAEIRLPRFTFPASLRMMERAELAGQNENEVSDETAAGKAFLREEFKKVYHALDPPGMRIVRPGGLTEEQVKLMLLLGVADESPIAVADVPYFLDVNATLARHTVEGLQMKGFIDVAADMGGNRQMRLSSVGVEYVVQQRLMA